MVYERYKLGLSTERPLGLRQPSPVVGVRSPGVGVLKGKRQSVVYGRYTDVHAAAAPFLKSKYNLVAIFWQFG